MSNYIAWDVNANDFPAAGSIGEKISFTCRYGLLAPSVHNSQPWRFEVSGTSLRISLEHSRLLDAGDPTGREGWISLGACVENVVLAGQYFGLEATLKVSESSMVELHFRPSKPDPALETLVQAMKQRVSNRKPYDSLPVKRAILDEINAVSIPGAKVLATDDEQMIGLLADFTGRAIGIALSTPSFRHELASLIHHNWTRSPTGMPGFGLGISHARSILESKLVRTGAAIEAQSKKERLAMHSSAAAVLVFTDGDTAPYWLNAGRAYEQAALSAVARGLSCSTTAAVVEAADYHLDIEQLADTSQRLQTVMRIGYSRESIRHSPRLNLGDVLTFSS